MRRRSRTVRFGAWWCARRQQQSCSLRPPAPGRHFERRSTTSSSFVDSNFCDAGLTVEVAVVLDIRVHANPHGRDRLVYFLQHGTEDRRPDESGQRQVLDALLRW